MVPRATLGGVNASRLLAVALGGALGTLARLGADQATTPLPFGHELAILVVNLAGAFALGMASGHGLSGLSPALREGLTTGLLGSYTTLSAVSIIVSTATVEVGLAYLGATFVVGILVAWAGLLLGRHTRGARPAEVAP